jgi:hypothetical protein
MTSTFDPTGLINPHLSRCVETYQQSTSIQQSPCSDSSDSSDDSSESVESIASSQTSYSSQEEQWSIPEIQPDTLQPVGKPICLPAGRYVVPEPTQQHARRTVRDGPPPGLVRQHERKGQFVYHLVGESIF